MVYSQGLKKKTRSFSCEAEVCEDLTLGRRMKNTGQTVFGRLYHFIPRRYSTWIKHVMWCERLW